MERVWAMGTVKGSNNVAFGFDEVRAGARPAPGPAAVFQAASGGAAPRGSACGCLRARRRPAAC
jgi:hypothetical protein